MLTRANLTLELIHAQRAALGLADPDKDPLSGPVGKPRAGYEVRELFTIRLEPSIAEYLRGIGEGNLAAGIMSVAREHRKRSR